MDKILELEKEIEEIKERNAKVEADKAWEMSSVRKILVALITYILISVYMIYLGVNKPWLNAVIPTLGFILSTMTISWAKVIWSRAQKK